MQGSSSKGTAPAALMGSGPFAISISCTQSCCCPAARLPLNRTELPAPCSFPLHPTNPNRNYWFSAFSAAFPHSLFSTSFPTPQLPCRSHSLHISQTLQDVFFLYVFPPWSFCVHKKYLELPEFLTVLPRIRPQNVSPESENIPFPTKNQTFPI